MKPLKVTRKGNFKKTMQYLDRLETRDFFDILEKYGELGVQALSAVTPVRTGKTAASWRYRIEKTETKVRLIWENTNETDDGQNVVKLLIRGHGTRNGSWYRIENFVTPAIKPIIDTIIEDLAKEVKK